MIPRQVPVAAPAHVRQRLLEAAPGPREVVHASASAIYVDLDGWCLGLVSATATRVPCALWSTLPDLVAHAGSPVAVRDGVLVLGDDELRITRLADPRATTVGRHENPPSAPEVLLSHQLDLPRDGRLTTAHLDRLLGRGPGLTPLGDAETPAYGTRERGVGVAGAVRRRLGVTTLLSATLIDCAIRGEVLPQLGAWLADPSSATRDALLAVGATSGTGLLAGASLALTSASVHPLRRTA